MSTVTMPELGSFLLRVASDRKALVAEVERHRDRTMTVIFMHEVETVTRCGVCKEEHERPCAALRRLAQPYSEAPGFRDEWRL